MKSSQSVSHSVMFDSLRPLGLQAPLFTEFSRQEHWSGEPSPSPGDLPHPGIEPRSPALQADSKWNSWGRQFPRPLPALMLSVSMTLWPVNALFAPLWIRAPTLLSSWSVPSVRANILCSPRFNLTYLFIHEIFLCLNLGGFSSLSSHGIQIL